MVNRGEKNALSGVLRIFRFRQNYFAGFFRIILENEIWFWRIKCSMLQLKKISRGEDDFQDCAGWVSAGGLLWFGFGAGELL